MSPYLGAGTDTLHSEVSVCRATRLQVGLPGFRIPVRTRDFSLLQNAQKGPGAHPAFYSIGTGVLSRGYSDWGVASTTHLHLVPRFRMSGAIPLFPLHAFMA